jgi:hypothetical protein
MRLKMDRLSKESLEGYGDLPFDKKLELHIDKLEVEADAQRKIIDQLVAAGERNADSQILDAEETLFLIGERLKKLYASRGLSDDKLAKLGLDKTPRLFSLGEHSADEIAGPAAKRALDQVGKSIDDADVQKILSEDYTFHRHNETGPIFRITRKPGRGDTVPHLQLEGRSIKKGKGRTNAAEQESDAALEWNTSQQQLAEMQKLADEGTATADQQVWLQHAAPAFRTELADRIAKNTMDEATAGMLCKWGHTLEQIESRSGGQYTVAYFLKHFDTLDGALSSRMSGFRDNVRMSTCDYLMTIGSPRERCDALYGLLDSMPAGDSRTRGEVFTEFRRRVMELEVDADELAIYDVEPMLPNGKVAKPVPFTGDDLANTRTADAVVDVRSEVEAHLPAGRYAIEDKTGKGAFKLDQAEDYAKRSSETIARRAEGDLAKGAATGGFRQTADGTESVYDGIVYVFSRSSEAQAALRKMAENDLVAPLLGRHPGGIHVFQFNEHGLLEAATARSWAP